MSNATAFPARQFLVPHNPREKNLPSTWLCVDDRNALGLTEPYRQIAAGVHGVGGDWQMARALDASQLRGKTGMQEVFEESDQVHEVGSFAAKILLGHGVVVLSHHGCAGEGKAMPISEIIVSPERRNELEATVREILPDISDLEIELGVAGHGKLLASGRYTWPEIAARALDEGFTLNGVSHPPIQRVSLHPGDHIANDFIANHQPFVAFDPLGAKEKYPAYHASLGDMHRELFEPLAEVLPASNRNFEVSTALRHAGVVLALPRPDGMPLRIHHIV